jgi:hypothetical protein
MTDDGPNEGYEVVLIEPKPHGPRSFALHFGSLDKFDRSIALWPVKLWCPSFHLMVTHLGPQSR